MTSVGDNTKKSPDFALKAQIGLYFFLKIKITLKLFNNGSKVIELLLMAQNLADYF